MTLTLSSLAATLGPTYLVLVAWPLARIDIKEHRLPNRLTLPAIPITILGQVAAVLFGENLIYLITAFVSAVIAFGGCLLLNKFAGLGMGDVKLIAAITLALAWFSPILPAIAFSGAFILAGAVALVLVLLQKTSMGSNIALGPYLLVGFVICLIGQGLS